MKGGTVLKIDRIHIGDFGIFKNAYMDDIGSGIVLIGGRNRAGKSTFMEALRCLAFGIQKSSIFPPANVEYLLESDITSDNKEKFNIKVQGYGEPRLYPLSNVSSINIKDIYNVDKYTYRELYTISLDELNNISKGDSKLQSVLLGAGFKEALILPEIIKEFSKEAERIGGKKGSPSTKMFKSYSSIISNAVKDKEKALRESSEYAEKESSLHQTLGEIQIVRQELDKTDNSLIVLDVLKENFGDIKSYKEIESKIGHEIVALSQSYDRTKLIEAKRLRDKYASLLKEYNDNISIFRKVVNLDLNFKDKLLQNKDIIQKLEADVSGFNERLRIYSREKSKWEEDKKNIIIDIHRINENFNGSFREIMDIKCDDLEIGELNKLDSDLRDTERSIDELNNKKSALSSQICIYEETASKSQTSRGSSLSFINIMLICLFAANVVVVIFESIHSSNAGLYYVFPLFILAASGISMLYINKYKSTVLGGRTDNKGELLRLKGELEASRNCLKNKVDISNNIIMRLDYYKKLLMLGENTTPMTIKDNLISLQNIKNRIVKLSLWKKDMEEAENRLKHDADSILSLFIKLGLAAEKIVDIENFNIYSKRVEEIAAYLPTAALLEDSFYNLEAVKNNIHDLVERNFDDSTTQKVLEDYIAECIKNEEVLECRHTHETLKKSLSQVVLSERVRKGLIQYEVKKGEEEPLLRLINIYENYSGFEEINIEYERLKPSKEMLLRRLDETIEKSERLKNEINGILVSDKIKNAEEAINNARGGMRPIAEKYAVYATASFILSKIYKNFMDKTQNSLLKDSSELLKSITGGEYVNILPPIEAQSVDFRTRLENGLVHESSQSLSRATREQLFLSVRINRIRENASSLPVIIDDSFVNFDSIHIKHTLEIISELSRTNQIFILTCHPYMVEYISALNKKIQYWKLENGRFFNLDKDSLLNYLSVH
jgi:uncharacterized protein YhaN